MPEHFVSSGFIAVCPLADREIASATLVAFAANDSEGDDDAVSHLQSLVLRAHFHDFAHELVTHDVALLHARYETIKQMKVGATDGTTCHFDDRIAGVLDARVGNGVAADVMFSMPA